MLPPRAWHVHPKPGRSMPGWSTPVSKAEPCMLHRGWLTLEKVPKQQLAEEHQASTELTGPVLALPSRCCAGPPCAIAATSVHNPAANFQAREGSPPARILVYAPWPVLTPPTPMMGSRPFVSRYMSRSTAVDGSSSGFPLRPPTCMPSTVVTLQSLSSLIHAGLCTALLTLGQLPAATLHACVMRAAGEFAA